MATVLAPFLVSLAGLCTSDALPAQQPQFTPSEFVRFVREGDGGHLDTAITTYKKGDVEVVFYGAVHIADERCYQELNDRFTTCDVLLYELVGPENYRPSRDANARGTSLISLLQQGLKNSLELSFQLDAIDYSPANFVHADMTPEEFADSMEERGESMLSIMLDMMLAGSKLQRERQDDEGAEPEPPVDLVAAFRSGEGRHTLRMLFASQLQQVEEMMVGGKAGSTLLEGRNEKCLAVLQREIAAGRKRIGIYYGAAHLPHMERRLVTDMGFQRTGQEWLVAWDCKKRPDVKVDRALRQLRNRTREELAALAAVLRPYRVFAGSREVPSVRELAAAQRDGQSWYPGPMQDPWGNDYVLQKRPTGSRWQAVSAGPDGQLGTADDLVAQEPSGRGALGR